MVTIQSEKIYFTFYIVKDFHCSKIHLILRSSIRFIIETAYHIYHICIYGIFIDQLGVTFQTRPSFSQPDPVHHPKRENRIPPGSCRHQSFLVQAKLDDIHKVIQLFQDDGTLLTDPFSNGPNKNPKKKKKEKDQRGGRRKTAKKREGN